MTYIRKMKDGSEKKYYTLEDVDNELKIRIRNSAEELRKEFRKYKKKDQSIKLSKKISYV